MKMTKVLLLAFMVLLPLAIQDVQAQEADSPVAGVPEASAKGHPSKFKAAIDCLDYWVKNIGKYQGYIKGQGMGLKEIGCKILADQTEECRYAMKFVLGLDAVELDAACGLPSFSPSGAPTAAN